MPKTVDHDEYRNILLEKSYDLFSRKGYSNVTMREIAKENGVSTGTLYHYFPNKAAILEQLISWVAERNVDQYRHIAGADLSLETKIGTLTKLLADTESDYLNHLSLSLDLMHNDPSASKEVLHGYAEIHKNAIITILGVDRDMAEFIVIYILGCAAHAKISPKGFSFRNAVMKLEEAASIAGDEPSGNVMELVFRSAPTDRKDAPAGPTRNHEKKESA